MKPFPRVFIRSILLTGLMIFTVTVANAITYYSFGNNAPNLTTSWWTNTNGTGAHPANFTNAADIFIVQNGNTYTSTAVWIISGSIQVATGGTLATGGTNSWTLTIGGTTSVTGTLTLNNMGAKTFTGNVTINSGGTWNETAIALIGFGGNLQNDGTFTTSSGVHTFSGTTKTISGTNTVSIASVTISGTTSNNGTLTVSTAIAGVSTLTNGATGILNFGGTSITPTLTATAAGNTVNYNLAGVQTLKATTYSNFTVSGSGVKTTTGVTVNGIMTIAGTASCSAVPTYGASSTLYYDGSAAQLPGVEFPASFVGTGGVVSDNPLGVTMNAIKTVSKLTVNAGAVFNTGATSTWTLTVSGATSVSGTLNLTNAAIKTFTGDITVNSGGTLSIDNTSSDIIAGNITVSSGGLMNHYVNYVSSNIITMTGNLDISGTYDYTGFTPAIFMNAPSGTRTIKTGTTSVFYLLLRTATYNAIGPVTVDGPFYAMWNVNAGSFHTNGQTIIANWGVVNAGGTLFVDGGSLTINGANGGLLSANTVGGANAAVTVSSGTVNTTGINMGASPFVSTFTHSGGTITTTSLTIDNTSAYTSSNSPSLTVNGTMNINSGTFTTTSTGTPVINISGDLITASGGTFSNIAGCSPNVTINGNVTNAGTLTPAGTATIGVKGNWTNNGTSTATGGTVTFNGTGNQAIGGTSITTFGSLVINPSAGITVSTTNNVSILSNLTVTTGIFDISTFDCNRTTSGGTCSLASNATLKLADGSGGPVGSNFPNSFATNTLDANSTVEYNGSIAQTIYATPTYGHLTLSTGNTKTAGGILTVAGNLNINTTAIFAGSTFAHSIAGDWYNNVSVTAYTPATSTVNFNGVAAQTIGGTAGTTFNNLMISNNVNLAIQDTILGTLSFGGSNRTFAANDFLTLKSTASGTARVADITNNGINSGNTITGNVKVERFIAARRAWRLLTAPITSAQTINAAWQEGQTSSNSLPGYGTHITGGTVLNGFDIGNLNNSSLKTYQPATNTWAAINSTYVPITDLPGYMLFVRGDRGVNLSQGANATPSNTVLSSTGQLKTNNQNITVASAGFTVIGNPYASPLNLNQIGKTNSTNIQDNFYVFDPKLTGINNVGAFVNISWNGFAYDITPNGGGSSISQYIQSGSAFFARSANGTSAGTLVIKEVDKSGSGSDNVYSPLPNTAEKLTTNLYSVNADGSSLIVDGVLNSYAPIYSNAVDGMDAEKLINFAENLSTQRDGKLLVVERRQPVELRDTIFFNISLMRKKSYKLEFIPENLESAGLKGSLEDTYLKTFIPVNLNSTSTVEFTVNADAASSGANRFRLVFTKLTILPFPFTFKNVRADLQNKDVTVEWITENEENIKSYDVELSANGLLFEKATTVMAKANNSTENYQWIDADASPGIHYYRIRSVNVNGDVLYSHVMKVAVSTGKSEIMIYPNPVVNGRINLKFINQDKGNYVLKLIDNLGRVLITKEIYLSRSNVIETIKAGKNRTGGTYRLEVINPDKNPKSLKVIFR